MPRRGPRAAEWRACRSSAGHAPARENSSSTPEHGLLMQQARHRELDTGPVRVAIRALGERHTMPAAARAVHHPAARVLIDPAVAHIERAWAKLTGGSVAFGNR